MKLNDDLAVFILQIVVTVYPIIRVSFGLNADDREAVSLGMLTTFGLRLFSASSLA